MNILQVLNNNIVMAKDDEGKKIVVVGTGIGYYRKKGDSIDETKVQQIFKLAEDKTQRLVRSMSLEVVEIVKDIGNYAIKYHGIELSDEVLFMLADHIDFAVKRLKEGLELDNPFLGEIKLLFKDEYDIGVYTKGIIEDRMKIEIPDEEVAYICMHIISAKYHKKKSVVSKTFEIVNIALKYIKENYLSDLKEDSISYNRLVTHLKFFAERYVNDNETVNNDTLLNETLRETFEEETACINELSDILKEKYGREVTDSEKNYIIIHLRNCKSSD